MKLSNRHDFSKVVFILVTLSVAAFQGKAYAGNTADDTTEQMTVTGSPTESPAASKMTPEEKIAAAQKQIYLIQTDPGFYYQNGASGARHRVDDVNAQKDIIAHAQTSEPNRMPAATQPVTPADTDK